MLESSKLSKINFALIAINIITLAWSISWHYELFISSLISIASLLILLVYINLELKNLDIDSKTKIFIRLPFEIYFGWVAFFLITNVATLAVSLNWTAWGLSREVWVAIVMNVFLILSVLVTLKFKSYAFAGSIIWALIGLLVSHLIDYSATYLTAWIVIIFAIVVMALSIIYLYFKDKKVQIEDEKK